MSACMFCDYSLKGLSGPKCPECGRRTTASSWWRQLRGAFVEVLVLLCAVGLALVGPSCSDGTWPKFLPDHMLITYARCSDHQAVHAELYRRTVDGRLAPAARRALVMALSSMRVTVARESYVDTGLRLLAVIYGAADAERHLGVTAGRESLKTMAASIPPERVLVVLRAAMASSSLSTRLAALNVAWAMKAQAADLLYDISLLLADDLCREAAWAAVVRVGKDNRLSTTLLELRLRQLSSIEWRGLALQLEGVRAILSGDVAVQDGFVATKNVLKQGTTEQQSIAIWFAGAVWPAEAVVRRVLEESLDDPRWEVKWAALSVLVCGEAKVLIKCRVLCYDSQIQVAVAAIQCVARSVNVNDDASEVLSNVMNVDNRTVQLVAVREALRSRVVEDQAIRVLDRLAHGNVDDAVAEEAREMWVSMKLSSWER